MTTLILKLRGLFANVPILNMTQRSTSLLSKEICNANVWYWLNMERNKSVETKSRNQAKNKLWRNHFSHRSQDTNYSRAHNPRSYTTTIPIHRCKYYISWCSYKLKVQHICPDFNDFKCNVWKGNFSGCLFFRLSSDCAAAAGDLCFQAVIGNWQISSASKRGGRGKGIVQNRMNWNWGKRTRMEQFAVQCSVSIFRVIVRFLLMTFFRGRNRVGQDFS